MCSLKQETLSLYLLPVDTRNRGYESDGSSVKSQCKLVLSVLKLGSKPGDMLALWVYQLNYAYSSSTSFVEKVPASLHH